MSKRTRKNIAWEHFYPEGNGKAKKGYVLHHKDVELKKKDIDRYNQWNVEDLVMIERTEHNRIHNLGVKRSEETCRKIGDAHRGQVPWNIGKQHSEETKRKIREKAIGRTIEEETRLKLSEQMKGKRVGENHPMYGKHHSDESKLKMSIASTGENNSFYGKHHSDESKLKMSIAHSGENHPMYGKHHSPETIKKMSDARRRHYELMKHGIK